MVCTTVSYSSKGCGRKYMISLKPENQLALQHAGNMTHNRVQNVDHLLVELTGISICHHRSTLGALIDGNITNFLVKKIRVSVKDHICKQRMFIVDSIAGYICQKLKRLIENDLFVHLSINICLPDNTVIVHVGGDKGQRNGV